MTVLLSYALVNADVIQITMSRELDQAPCLSYTGSVGTGHSQDMLADIVEGHLLRDRRNLV